MSTRTRIIVGTIGVLCVVLLAAALFLRYEIRKSFPVTSGTLAVSGLDQPVTVERDEYGVPTITAATEHDLMVASGYVQAQDRLWQMDLARRAGEGRLSELFGAGTLPYDRMFRIVGIRRIAETIVATMPKDSRDRLQWFAAGVNAFIASSRGRYPAEFDLLGYQPEPWTPVHSVIIARMLAWGLNLSWWTDVTYGIIADKVGLQRALDLMPGIPPGVPPAVPANEWHAYAGLAKDYMRRAQEFAAATGMASLAGGSNAWVVSPRHSATGEVILANDTHLQLTQPPLWYEMEMRMPGLHVRGMAIPGMPAIVAGRNDRIAWGVTNVMADEADFYVERIDSVTGSTYAYGGTWRPLTIFQEEIGVRGDSAVPVTIRLTHHGPIISDITTPLTKAHPPYVVSMRWTGNEPDDQFGAFTRINRAANWDEFAAAVRSFTVPGQNFVYGDADGNIGYWCGAKIPIRSGRNSILPLPGWDPSTEWKGFVPSEQMPHRLNPPEGYIASANNKIVDDTYPYHITDLWEPASRIQRLNDVLGKPGERFTVRDCELLQNDSYSHIAEELTPYILNALRDSSADVPMKDRVFEYFRNWNFQYTRDDIATAIFQEFMVHFLRDVFEDEMGEDAFHDWVMLTNIPLRVTLALVHEGTSPWFDDVRTPAVEGRDDMIRKSLREAVEDLTARFGSETRNWRWGNLHTATIRHPFGIRPPLDKIFSIGPFPVAGASGALVSGEYDFNAPFAVTVGPSFRQIFDFAGDGPIRSILPSGESGQVYHAHYADQTGSWLNGWYRSAHFSTAHSPGGDRLTLLPRP